MDDTIRFKSGKIRGEKIRYKDGVGCAIWQLLKDSDDDEDEGVGLCFDFPDEQTDDILKVIEQMKKAEPTDYVPDEDYEKFKEEQKERDKKWWVKIHMKIEDFGIQFTPFDWRLTRLLVTRNDPRNSQHLMKVCKGFYLGPICITW